ncbi:hypothetical protein A1F95_07080 [Pyrenophora tritici-repentis]|nr:hypothetical protein A1F95_07080 [Pyrenophora tritici-repentis]
MDHSYPNNPNHMDFRPNSTLNSLDRKPSAFSFDDNSTLDSNILDTPVLMSPTSSTQGIFSPDTSIWEDFSSNPQFVDRTATSSVVNTNGNNPFFTEQSNNPFARLPPNQAATYGQQSWPVTDNSGSRTPTAPKPLNPFGPGDFGAASFVDQQQMPFGLPVHQNVQRNLFNIDHLIQSCTNEEELKELKQQKRLLRNRQAAYVLPLGSWFHAPRLVQSTFWSMISPIMQDDFAAMRIEYDALVAEKENWHRESMEMHHLVNQLQFDKEELVRTHTVETGELRKKVSVLTERLEAATGNGMAVAPSTTFTDFASEMDNLNMGNSDWDNYIFVNDFASDDQPTPQQNQELSLVSRTKDEDKPVASGLLLMLLLCGAFVASKSGGAAPPIPRMPDEVRAASATVLDSIFKDAGVSTTLSEQGLIANHVVGMEPTPSGMAWPKTTMSGSELAGISGSLDQLHSHLTGPTKEQEHEQLFSITPDQYNSMTSLDFTRSRYSVSSDDLSDPLSPGSQPSHRRNLAETLAAMREQSKGDSAAEIYTRSLLWDKIAPEVVHEFKRIVEESAAMSRPGTSEGTKVENMG